MADIGGMGLSIDRWMNLDAYSIIKSAEPRNKMHLQASRMDFVVK